jgi:hypothetical protein
MRGENRLQVAIEFGQEMTANELDANLALIAAAPDLLDALICIVNTHDSQQYTDTLVIKQAREVISKIRGETK